MRSSRRTAALVTASALLFAACASDGSGGDGDGAPTSTATAERSTSCDWTMAGQALDRLHASACDAPDAIGIDTLDRLVPVWSLDAGAEVTGAPTITDDAVYYGDWAGIVHAVDRSSGTVRWTRKTPIEANLYAGQIPASPSIAEIDGAEALIVASGRTVLALATDDGTPVWQTPIGTSDDEDPTEIQGSPAVADDLVLVPTDVHNAKDGRRSGLVALSLADGTERWTWDPEADVEAGGCGSLWGTPSVDLEARLVVIGTGSCFTPESFSETSEAIVGVDLDTGELRWSYQPRTEYSGQDWDFAGAPNLFEIDGRPVAGLGSKDGRYYVVDRVDGELVWEAEAVKQEADEDGFAFGGFIGATALAPDADGRLVIAGGTAVGDCPCQHGFDAATGEAIWQSPEAGGTYGASAAAGGVVFTAGIDQTLRAYDLATGDVRWKEPIGSLSASGPAIAGDLLVIGVGFREPGNDAPAAGGIRAFRVLAEGEAPPSTTTTTLPDGPAVTALEASGQACVGAPCDLDFTLKDPPAGLQPTLTLEITPSPLRIRIEGDDLGDPADWLGEDGPAAADGATTFAVFITPRDDKPELGSIVCILDEDFDCEGTEIALPADGYTRLSILALADPDTPPAIEEGFDRLVTTHSFDPGLVPAS